MSEKPKAVVTGASGFIGSHLVDSLLHDGREVVGLDIKPAHRKTGIRYQFIQYDIREPLGPFIREAGNLKGAEWFHLAALTSPWQSVEQAAEFERTNLHGTEYVLDAASLTEAGGFVFVSTSALYGEVACPRKAKEDDTLPLDMTPYAATKLRGEYLVTQRAARNGWRGACLRLGNIYGPRQDPRTEAGVVAIFIEALLSEEPRVTIYGEGGIRDFVYVGDCNYALREAMGKEGDQWIGTVNIGTGIGISVWEILRAIEHALDIRAHATIKPHRAGETGRTVLDNQRARDLFPCMGLGVPVSLHDGLQMTINWFREKGKK